MPSKPNLLPATKKSSYFPVLKRTREAMAERAYEALDLFFDTLEKAKEAGEYEQVFKAIQWYVEHSPRDKDGKGVIDISIDKPVQIEGAKGPIINVGVAIGGIGKKPQALPPHEVEVIEVEPGVEPDAP